MDIPSIISGVIILGIVSGLVITVLSAIYRHRSFVRKERARTGCDLAPHDYHKENGGNGYPMHFYQYTCWQCGARFYI